MCRDKTFHIPHWKSVPAVLCTAGSMIREEIRGRRFHEAGKWMDGILVMALDAKADPGRRCRDLCGRVDWGLVFR